MSQRRADSADLPGWPRLLTLDLAAAYCGVSPNAFEADVGKLWPEPVGGMRRKVWDIVALTQVIDTLPNAAVQSPPPKSHGEMLAETEGARRAAWEKRRKQGHKAA